MEWFFSLRFLKKRYLKSATLGCLPIIWFLQGAASPVVEDDLTSRVATEYGVAAWRAHPAGAP